MKKIAVSLILVMASCAMADVYKNIQNDHLAKQPSARSPKENPPRMGPSYAQTNMPVSKSGDINQQLLDAIQEKKNDLLKQLLRHHNPNALIGGKTLMDYAREYKNPEAAGIIRSYGGKSSAEIKNKTVNHPVQPLHQK